MKRATTRLKNFVHMRKVSVTKKHLQRKFATFAFSLSKLFVTEKKVTKYLCQMNFSNEIFAAVFP